VADCFLFYQSILQKGVEMKKTILFLLLMPFILTNLWGCWFIVGGAAGVAGTYVLSKDTIQVDTDRPYDILWSAALKVSQIRGTIKQEDARNGFIELEADGSRIWIRLVRLSRTTTRLRVSARTKMRLPNLELAQSIFAKIMEEAK
jgi:hypothetical protein